MLLQSTRTQVWLFSKHFSISLRLLKPKNTNSKRHPWRTSKNSMTTGSFTLKILSSSLTRAHILNTWSTLLRTMIIKNGRVFLDSFLIKRWSSWRSFYPRPRSTTRLDKYSKSRDEKSLKIINTYSTIIFLQQILLDLFLFTVAGSSFFIDTNIHKQCDASFADFLHHFQVSNLHSCLGIE